MRGSIGQASQLPQSASTVWYLIHRPRWPTAVHSHSRVVHIPHLYRSRRSSSACPCLIDSSVYKHLHLRGLRSASTWPRVVSISMLRSSRSSSHRSHQHHAAALRRRHPPDGPVLCVRKGPLESHGVQRPVALVRKRWWPFWWVHDVQDCGAPPLLPRIRLALRILYLRVLCCCADSVCA